MHKSISNTTHQLNYKSLLPLVKEMSDKKVNVHEPASNLILIISKHRHYRHLVIELAKAEKTKLGKLKNPIVVIDPLELVWKTTAVDEIKFYSAVSKFKNQYHESKTQADLDALKAIVLNPLKLPVYQHNESISSNINASSLSEISFSQLTPSFEITVDERAGIFTLSGCLNVGNKVFGIDKVSLSFNYFIAVDNELFLIPSARLIELTNFFKENSTNLVLDRSDYLAFNEDILSLLEEKIKINYAYLKQATSKQYQEQGFDLPNEQLIYLSESEDFVLLTPVMRYGGLEIPVISQKQIKTKDKRGQIFTLVRNEEQELQFIANVVRAHPYFKEQVAEFSAQLHTDCFYLHRKHFLEPSWFLDAFEAWRSKGIVVLGFNALKQNKLSPFKANISIKVNSGVDWFETAIRIKFNKQTVSLKHLHKSIRNKSKFVALDDGTLGILPEEWLKKFDSYFATSEIVEETLRTPHISFAVVEELYEQHFFDDEAVAKINLFKDKLYNFSGIKETAPPRGLKASLRGYQAEGVNWLNFIDQFNFGGVLADDMGLGKTIQIIAFMLLQKERGNLAANLVVVPASLVFNWQHEIAKFAPSLKVTTIYGAQRNKDVVNFSNFDVVLTSYGTLLSDIKWLKEYRFNYVFLDESQAIKNTESQRYKAVRLLQARNRVAITGTPIENTTFDLYGQLSFVCPGLLGGKAYFKQTYAIPIDQFKLTKRAEELQLRIKPFILRRTKEQVAKELPDKTEMVIYCEMDKRQREVYDSCRNEIRDYLMGRTDDELTKSSMHVLQGITKLRQICNSPALISNDKDFGNASSKMDVLLEQIESKAPYHKILVFSQFVGMLNLIKEQLVAKNIQFSYLSGQTKNREQVVKSFQENDESRVFLISLKAGGVGLNLTEAEYVYLVDPWWNPAVENQAIDRTHRIGQHKNVMAVRLICPNTIEEKIMLMQEAKRSLATDIIRTDTTIFKNISKQELLNLIS